MNGLTVSGVDDRCREAPIPVVYTNHAGETRVRHLIPAEHNPFRFGESTFHKGPDGRPRLQWFFLAYDAERPDQLDARAYAMDGITAWGSEAVNAYCRRLDQAMPVSQIEP